MPYLSSYRGDYLGSYRGDPGLFGFIGKALKGGLGVVSKLGVPGISGAAGVVGGLLGGKAARRTRTQPIAAPQFPVSRMAMPGVQIQKVPGVRGTLQRIVPGGATGYQLGYRKRRRMNPANPKALRRAIRRQDSFVRLARKALKGSGYTIVSRGSRTRRPINIRESGPGSVTVR